jgi:predicted aspartyl protease
MDVPSEGAVVRWIFADESRRPFVMLGNGRRVLIDTGSSLGFAVSQAVAHSTGIFSIEDSETRSVRDIGGGTIGYRRVSPATINIGSLTLRNVPTEVLTGTVADAPMILGREALRPFYMAFDPIHRLILIAPSAG